MTIFFNFSFIISATKLSNSYIVQAISLIIWPIQKSWSSLEIIINLLNIHEKLILCGGMQVPHMGFLLSRITLFRKMLYKREVSQTKYLKIWKGPVKVLWGEHRIFRRMRWQRSIEISSEWENYDSPEVVKHISTKLWIHLIT